MKIFFLNFINILLLPFNFRISKRIKNDISMSEAVKRISIHKISVNTIIDCGASDGKWCRIAMDYFPDSNFIAIEPLHERKKGLEQLKLNYSNFDYALCVAAEKDDTNVKLNVSKDLDGSTIGGAGGKIRLVSSRTIDSLVSEKNLNGPFLLKLDTHGYEIPILKGAKNILLKTNIIIVEVYNYQITDRSLRFHEMCYYLEGLGFRCYDIADPMLRKYDQTFWQTDLFFARAESSIFNYNHYS